MKPCGITNKGDGSEVNDWERRRRGRKFMPGGLMYFMRILEHSIA